MIANYHTHTARCNHARDTEEQYVQAALEAGLEILGFADHTPYFFPGEYYSGFRMLPEQLPGYCDTVRSLRKKYAGKIRIPLGLELEYYPELLPELLPALRDAGIEYLLLGQHFIGNEIVDPYPAGGGYRHEHYSGSPTHEESVLRRYCHQTADAMNTGLFSYFAHPDLIFYTGSEQTYREHMRLICREAKSCGIPLEINLLGIREGRNYPNPMFWQLAAEEGCQAVLGCDAHAASHLLEKKAEQEARKMAALYGLEILDKVPLRSL